MKKCILILWLLIFGISFPLFAQTPPKAFIFLQPITGTGTGSDDKEYINKMLVNEIYARNCVLLDTPHGTDYILFGMITPYYYGYGDSYLKTATPAAATYTYNTMLQNTAAELYILQLTLRKTNTNETLVQQTLFFASIDDVYNFFPLLVHNLFAPILGYNVPPQVTGKQPFSFAQIFDTEDEEADSWRNKWLYFRGSFDFPITYYALLGDGLVGGIGIHNGDEINSPTRVAPIDNRIVAMPAGTFGFEVQFLNWMSIEPIFQVGWESLNDRNLVNLAAGAELKFPLKFMKNVVVEPYGAVSFPIPGVISNVFDSFPLLGFGGGLQLDIKGGTAGAFFIDVNYMYYGDTGIVNHYGDLYPNPPVIHYNRSVIGLGIGYKVGVINRKRANSEESAPSEKRGTTTTEKKETKINQEIPEQRVTPSMSR
jgi:hypothetical protein